MKVKNIMKKAVAGLLAATVIVTGIVVVPAEDVNAAGTGIAVSHTIEKAQMEITQTYVDGKTTGKGIPTKDGYLFGGWYEDEALTKPYANVAAGTTAWAKFVPSYVLSIKGQNYAATTSSSASTSVRLVTSVDCADYTQVGFEVIKDGATTAKTGTSPKVYEKLTANGELYGPDVIFGDASKYFAVLNLNSVGKDYFSSNTYVRPYWVTPDGAKVTGLPKYVRVDDGLDGYISVAVNLKTAEAIAAGVVNVSYDNKVLKFKEFYDGKVFQEMEVADKGTSVKCVGNVEKIENNATADDMYISLRFEILKDEETGKPLYSVMDAGGLTFGMDQIDFAANDESLTDTNVWNVLY